MEKFQKPFCYSPDIFMPHGEHSETRENDDDPFRKLNRGDGAHAFDVRGIVDYEMRDFGKRDSGTHLATQNSHAVRDGASPFSTRVFLSILKSAGGRRRATPLRSPERLC